MADRWPTSDCHAHNAEAKRPLLADTVAPERPPKIPAAEEDDAAFDDSFVVRRKQAAPDGEEDSRIDRALGERALMSSSSSWTTGSLRKEESSYSDDDGGGDGGAASLAELPVYGSGSHLHPHHKRRGTGSIGSRHRDRRRPPAEEKERESDRFFDLDHHDRSGGRREGRECGGGESSRRSEPSGHRHEEEEYYDDGCDAFSDSRSSLEKYHHLGCASSRSQRPSHHSIRHCDSSVHGASSAGIFSAVLKSCVGFFDGVHFKTVLVCMLGMTVIMKLDKPSFSPNVSYGMTNHKSYSSEISPGVRGGVVNVGQISEENDTEGGAEMREQDVSSAGEEAEPSMQQAPHPPLMQQQNQATLQFDLQQAQQAQQKQQGDPPQQMRHQDKLMAQQGYYVIQQQGVKQQAQAQAQQGYAPQQQQDQQIAQQGYYAVQQQEVNQQSQAQQGYAPQQQQDQQVAQQGYNVAQQQQQPVPNQYSNTNAQPSAGYAVEQQLVYNQSPLSPQQQQIVTQLGQPHTQFGEAVDALQTSPQQTSAGETVPQEEAPAASAEVDQQQVSVLIPAQDSPEGGEPGPTSIEVPLVPPPAPSSLLDLLSNFKNTWDPYEKTDIPMFWHIPKAGGSSIKDAMGGCHRFVQATEFGVTDGHIDDTEVAIVYPAVPGVADTDRSPFVNIDSTTVAGIQRAKSMGFADAQLADVVVSPFVFETNDLFTPTAKGRLFSVFRHPIDRAVSMFYYIRVADWEPSYKPELKEWTLEQYATSDIVENNWMTRQLSNQLGGELTEDNLKLAMEVVQTKFLVGLMTEIEPTMARCEKAFRWTYHVNPPNQEACRERLMAGGSNSNKKNKKPLEGGDTAWDLLAQQNSFDLRLYSYIEKLFEEQEVFVKGLPDNFRNVDGTCCKCYPPTYPPDGFTCPEAVKNEG